MRKCNFDQEGFCVLQVENPNIPKCSYVEDKQQRCKAKSSDLIDLCPNCVNPISECNCGTFGVVAKDRVVIVLPKTHLKLRERCKRD